MYGEDFSKEKMLQKSLPAAMMCFWVVNIVTFNRIFKEVKPL